jgi:RNA polymerase sigma factor (sigma-70 family)
VRRDRWIVPADDPAAAGADRRMPAAHHSAHATPQADPEARLLARERRARMTAAVDRLEGRQRTVFMLCHYGDCTPREVGAMIGLNESTVRVHLFRAARKLRTLLGGQP